MENELILIMDNGDTHIVIGETNLYWICGNCRFRKANKRILEVQHIVKPKKRKPPSKKKSEVKSQKPKVEVYSDE